ncbi:hypothetical protein [Floccifex sp.]|uniref:hypothetical protein n=1 Tax=Floccifex sp. TaxID=2815810 RepID=UPI002A755E08|nr:hypothetical protein [Floccifex sp.]MDD7282170.1 hypothetical protein [Erysipelotrichaceae bacterium]MDY2959063.1 hypothetical protein [Floccifex sp.]
MQLSRKEREMLSSDIQREYELLKQLGNWIRNGCIFTVVFIALAIYGWTGMVDPLIPNAPEAFRTFAKWAGLIGSILCGVFTLLVFLSHRNGKKSVQRKIKMFDDSKKRKTTK